MNFTQTPKIVSLLVALDKKSGDFICKNDMEIHGKMQCSFVTFESH